MWLWAVSRCGSMQVGHFGITFDGFCSLAPEKALGGGGGRWVTLLGLPPPVGLVTPGGASSASLTYAAGWSKIISSWAGDACRFPRGPTSG